MVTTEGDIELELKYKLKNTYSHKKTFDSIEDLEKHINKYQLRPENGDKVIKYDIISTYKKTQSIPVSYPELSKENGIKLLEKIKKVVPTDLIYSDWDHKRIWDILNSIKETHNINSIKEALDIYIDYLINNYDTLNLTPVKCLTDYKPCNGYGFDINGQYLLLRKSDVVFDRNYLHGRNVNPKGCYQLIDDDLKKILK